MEKKYILKDGGIKGLTAEKISQAGFKSAPKWCIQ